MKDVTVDKLMDDLRVVVSDAEELLKATAGQANEKVAAVRARAQASVDQAKVRMATLGDQVTLRSREAVKVTDEYVHDNPWQSIGVAAGFALCIGTAIAWPLLTGERAHYELAAGRPEVARSLMHTVEAFANEGGLLPEQVWDAPDVPERELFFGRPSGSAMPLLWAHAEYVKLLRSLGDGRVFDTPPQTVQRYVKDKVESNRATWRFNYKCQSIQAGKRSCIQP
mgnify:CR=1 FL=1